MNLWNSWKFPIIDLFLLQNKYKNEFEKSKERNKFSVTDTETYKTMKETDQATSDVSILIPLLGGIQIFLFIAFLL